MKKTKLLYFVLSILLISPALYAATPTSGYPGSDSVVVIYGCTNPKATNYNPLAKKDNGTCIFDSTIVYGCTDSTALNYNPKANHSNHNCIYTKRIQGCTDSLALNYNPKANINDGSCIYERILWGCTDSTAINYNPKANRDNGYCEYKVVIKGCMDKTAFNYNPLANLNNKSCIYTKADSLGCTDHFALNFNKFATTNNGSCIYPVVSDTISGCKDKRAVNFNPVATISNGSCVYDTTNIAGCKSPRALNYNEKAKHDDGNCIFARPGNVVSPKITKDEITAIADTVGKILAASCNFDYTLAIDTVYITGVKHISKDSVELDWAIKQGDLITTVKTEFLIKKKGTSLVYLSLICNQSAVADISSTLSSVRSKVSSIATDAVKAVTLSIFYVNAATTDVVNPTISEYGAILYPNPAKDQISLSLSDTGNNELQLIIYSVDGRKLITSTVSSVSGTNRFDINTSSLESGLHFLTIHKNGAVIKTLKFSKD
jgi:hypothetical protein